jgi:3'-5' exoribonuclease
MTQEPVLAELKEGVGFAGHLLAKEAAFKISAKGSEYLELKLADATGDLKGFLWDLKALEGDPSLVRADAFLWVKGAAAAYNGRLQLRLDKVRGAADSEVGDLGRFFPVSTRSVLDMLAELDDRIVQVRDPWIQRLLTALFIENGELRAAFSKAPAAKSMHHVCLGGLLEHTLSVLAMAHRACDHYSGMNRDLVVAGVFLHDVGKTAELTYDRGFGYSDEGNLLGHITLEALWIQRKIDQLPGFPEDLRLHLLHIVLAHHGKLEYGSPVLPKTPEAVLVHYLDDLDGKLEAMFRALESDPGPNSWTPFNRVMERMIFKRRWPKA